MEFLLGVFVGFIGAVGFVIWVGTAQRFKKYDPSQGQVWHPNGKPCTDGHKWCQEHAQQGKFHCEVCGYAMEQ